MSDASSKHEEGPHEGPIKTPKQLIVALVFAIIVPIVVIVMLAVYVATESKPGAGSDGLAAEAVARRIQPVASVEVRDSSDPATLKTGEQVYAAQCVSCHGSGVAGAPKFSDAAAWGPRIGQGYDTLLQHALKGKGAMGPQGGGDFSDLEIGRAVVYMANHGGAKFEEPKATAAAASAPKEQAAAAATPAPAAPAPAPTAAPAATAPKQADAGGAAPALYTQACAVCHAAGVAGAPKLGDKAAWAPRAAQGMDTLTANAIKGKGAMPPKGGSTASDADIKSAVTYMVNASK